MTPSSLHRRRLALAGITVVAFVLPAAAVSVTACAARTADTNQDTAAPAAPTGMPSRAAGPCPAASTPTPTTTASASGAAGDGATSRVMLNRLAGQLIPAPADHSSGAFTVISYRQWTADMSGIRNRPATTTMVVEDHVRTIAADNSGHDTITRYPAGTQTPGPGTPGAKTTTEQRAAGRAWDGIAAPSADPAVLAAEIDEIQPWENGPFAGLRAMSGTATATYLACPVRAAALNVLANMDATYSGATTDRAGRPGIAITVTTLEKGKAAALDTLVVDEATGVVLAYEMQLLRNPGGYRGDFPRTELYLLFLTSERRDTTSGSAGSSSTPS